MHLVDFTHPQRVPSLILPYDLRSAEYYVRLDELPDTHPYYYRDWALFRSQEWLEGGSAWYQAQQIVKRIQVLVAEKGLQHEVRPVVGSNDPAYDEALAQSLINFGYRPLVAETHFRPESA